LRKRVDLLSRIIRPPETPALYKSFNPLLTVSQ
jgi:hypothetical protein